MEGAYASAIIKFQFKHDFKYSHYTTTDIHH